MKDGGPKLFQIAKVFWGYELSTP